jgi:UDP-glucose 4-epimerase
LEPTIVITGASGFLGGALVEALRQKDAQIIPVSRRPLENGVRVSDYRQAPSGDVLVHLAEESNRSKARTLGEAYEKAAAETLAALVAKRYRRIIYASSAVLYGDGNPEAHPPDDPVVIPDIYTRVKDNSERLVLSTNCGIVVRLSNLYGPGMSSENVVSKILRQADGSGPLYVWDTGPVRDFIHIEDAAEAIAAMSFHCENKSGIFNVGTGIGTSIGDLARLVMDLAGKPDHPVVATNPSMRDSAIVLDIAHTTLTWNWRPRIDLKIGISDLLRNIRRIACEKER